jgi:hypothetical protein
MIPTLFMRDECIGIAPQSQPKQAHSLNQYMQKNEVRSLQAESFAVSQTEQIIQDTKELIWRAQINATKELLFDT